MTYVPTLELETIFSVIMIHLYYSNGDSNKERSTPQSTIAGKIDPNKASGAI